MPSSSNSEIHLDLNGIGKMKDVRESMGALEFMNKSLEELHSRMNTIEKAI